MNAIKNTTARNTNTQRFQASHRSIGAKLGVLAALIACAGCTVAQGSDTTSASTPPIPSPLPAPNAATVSIQGTAQASDGSPIAGAAVCLRPNPTTSYHASCTTSDGSGAWKLAGAPSNALVAITFIKTGFFPTLRPIGTATSDVTIPPGDGALIASSDAASLMGGAIDPGSGHLGFSTATPGTRPTAAATVILDAADGSRATPVYFDANGKPMLGAGSGTSGVFANLAPGYYAMTFFGASVACNSSSGLYGFPITAYTPDGQARMLLPIVEGFLTAPVAASCSPVGSGS